MANTDHKAPVIDALQFSEWSRRHLEELRDGGLTAVHATVAYHGLARETLSAIAAWNRRFREHADLVRPVRTAADIAAAQRGGRTGIILGAQNCSPIEDDIGLVAVMHDAGLKIMQLTYNNVSLCGGGCYDLDDPGLTRFGREVVAEMNRLGMVIDLSHSAERTTLETIDYSGRPVAVTHANPQFFLETPRNKSREVLRALAARGGMLGLSLYVQHLPDGPRCTMDAYVHMIARTVELMGADHVGIGSDMCRGLDGTTIDWMRNGRWRHVDAAERESLRRAGWPAQPDWFRSPADMPALADALSRAGFAPDEVDSIMGGNWMRFFRDGLDPAGSAPTQPLPEAKEGSPE